jgi:hypothetical protein
MTSNFLRIMRALVDVAHEAGVPDNILFQVPRHTYSVVPHLILSADGERIGMLVHTESEGFVWMRSNRDLPDEVEAFMGLCKEALNSEWHNDVTTESEHVAYCHDKMRGYTKCATKK